MDAAIRVDFLLRRNFFIGTGFEAAADADVNAFGVLPEHSEVDVLRSAPFQRAQSLVEKLDRPVVDEEIELEPRAKQDVARVTVIRNARIAKRADEDRIECTQCVV